MLRTKTALHEGAHGHEHSHGAELTGEQTLALLAYTLEHNRSHAGELHDLAHAQEAAQSVHEAVHFFEHGNDKLAEALLLAKGD